MRHLGFMEFFAKQQSVKKIEWIENQKNTGKNYWDFVGTFMCDCKCVSVCGCACMLVWVIVAYYCVSSFFSSRLVSIQVVHPYSVSFYRSGQISIWSMAYQ